MKYFQDSKGGKENGAMVMTVRGRNLERMSLKVKLLTWKTIEMRLEVKPGRPGVHTLMLKSATQVFLW